MSRVLAVFLGSMAVARVLSAQPPPPPPQITVDMPIGAAGAGVILQQMPPMPPRDNAQAARPGKSTLRGHVVAADSGQPLRRAQVRVTSPDLRENRMTTTDGDGKYEFKELPAGRYTVFASKGSFVGLAYG